MDYKLKERIAKGSKTRKRACDASLETKAARKVAAQVAPLAIAAPTGRDIGRLMAAPLEAVETPMIEVLKTVLPFGKLGDRHRELLASYKMTQEVVYDAPDGSDGLDDLGELPQPPSKLVETLRLGGWELLTCYRQNVSLGSSIKVTKLVALFGVPDNPTRIAALKLAYEVMGSLAPQKVEVAHSFSLASLRKEASQLLTAPPSASGDVQEAIEADFTPTINPDDEAL